jgi:hypothetical protein
MSFCDIICIYRTSSDGIYMIHSINSEHTEEFSKDVPVSEPTKLVTELEKSQLKKIINAGTNDLSKVERAKITAIIASIFLKSSLNNDKTYRQVSVIVHPDKNQGHKTRAQQVFNICTDIDKIVDENKIGYKTLLNRKKDEAIAIVRQVEQGPSSALPENAALGVSAIIGFIASIYSQTLQSMLFGKVFFGSAILFGYAMPMVNLAVASMVFGLVIFSLALIIISVAKNAEGKPLFSETLDAIFALYRLVAVLAIIRYTLVIEQLLFGCILLEGAIIVNCIFAGIFVCLMFGLCSAISEAASFLLMKKLKVGELLSVFCSLFTTFSFFMVDANSEIIAACAAGLITLAVPVVNKIIESGYGFSLTIYAIAFMVLSVYASPIQIAIFGHVIMPLLAPLLSDVVLGAIASLVAAPILTMIYRAIEKIVAPSFMDAYVNAEAEKKAAGKEKGTNPEKDKAAVAKKTVFGVSAVIGFIASISSQTLQSMLFGKVFFSSAMLFGYAMPMVNLVAANMVFGLVMFGLTLAIISIAKYIENADIINKIYKIANKHSNSMVGVPVFIFISCCRFANPISQHLFGITIVGGSSAVIISSLIVAVSAAFLSVVVVTLVKEAIKKSGHGFNLTMYVLSFIMLSVYASPIQIAIFGHALILLTPTFVAMIASFVTAPILTGIYRTTETVIAPSVIDSYETLKFVPKNLTFKVANENVKGDQDFYKACGYNGAF